MRKEWVSERILPLSNFHIRQIFAQASACMENPRNNPYFVIWNRKAHKTATRLLEKGLLTLG